MYCMRSFTKQDEEAGKVEALLHGAPAIILPELMFVMSYSVRVEEDGDDWICCTKMLNSVEEVVAELNASAEIDGAIIHTFDLVTPVGSGLLQSHQLEGLEMMSVETWDIAGYQCFGLRCEVEDDIVYNFVPIAAPGTVTRSDVIYQESEHGQRVYLA